MKATTRSTLPFTRVIPRKAARTPALLLVLALLICLSALAASAYAQTSTFTAEELLGKPTNNSVTVNIVPASAIQYRYEYGTASGAYTQQTAPVAATAGQPSEVTIQGLSPNTQYFYRMVYDADMSVTDGDFETRAEHAFRTQRAAGASFAFTVTSDIHNNMGTNEQNVMTNILGEHPDFHIDLGDTFLTDGVNSESAARTRYVNQRGTSYFGKIGSSVPIFLATGNHEDEEGWNLDDTGTYATGLWNIASRKAYFPTPTQDGFYSANTDPLPTAIGGDTNREDYYAWTWGDALFVVIDEFQYTMNLPYAPAAGELSDDSMTGDQWSWTLGLQQYNWLKQTLQNSHAKYKFVFSHNMLGGVPRAAAGAGAGYVRGGAEAAGYFEWGGKNADGTSGFSAHRSSANGWDKTIQQLFEENGVSAYFHGHDHGFVYERRPDVTQGAVVYQEVPSGGSMSLFSGIYDVNETDAAFDTTAQRSGNGHLRVAVGSDHATVDFILAGSGAVDYSYDIESSEASTDPNINVSGSLSAFSSQPGTPSAQQSYTVSGSNLTAGILITAPANFQVSTTSGSGWASSLTLPQTAGTVASTPIYVRFNRATEGTSTGDIVHTSAGATARNQAVTGTAAVVSGTPITFTGQELLGRPTNTSMTIKVVPDANITLYYEYGTTSGAYTNQTPTKAATAGQPAEVEITGLLPSVHYYYRMKYSSDGGTSWVTRDEHSFWTQRATASTFTFDITTDSHINIQLGNASNWTSTLNGVASDNPDFLVDLGDTVAMDNGSTSVALGDTAAAEQKYKDTLPYFNRVSASSAIFLLAGNHEQQEAWHLQGTLANSLPIMGKNAEKKFYANPSPNSFYSGDSRTISQLSGDHLVQDYYSWTWGDALFVTISPFWTTTTKPYTTSAGGGETDATGSGNRWDWTLGSDQFNWLKSTLANSNAKYKFVLMHQMVGGNGMTSPVDQVNYGHGGIDAANFVEWGGYNTNGTTYAWSTNRNTTVWGSQPIRQMMEANGVTALFHGHDHQMAYETANGMVSQAVPSGSFTGSFGNYTTGNTYTVRDGTGGTSTGQTVWADSTQGPGHLRVTVGPAEAKVEFVRYNQTTAAAYTYTMEPNEVPAPTVTVTAPTGTSGSYAQGDPVSVAWTASSAVAAGEFGVWAVSSTGSWYGGDLVAAHGSSANYTHDLRLNVPAGSGYSTVVMYRPVAGSGAWTTGAYSPGTFAVRTIASLTVTAPSGSSGSYAQGDPVSVAWTADAAVADGEFGVWAVSSTGGWYGGDMVAAHGSSANYTHDLRLNVPTGGGWSTVVMYRPVAGSGAWTTGAYSPGTFAVTAAFSLAVTAPTGTSGSYAQGDPVSVAWTASSAVAAGEFGVWAVSSTGGWYGGDLVAAHGSSANYTHDLRLNVPAGSGYSTVVMYRPVAGSGAWTTGAYSPGTFAVTAAFSLAVTAPTGTSGSYPAGTPVTVAWTASSAVAAGEFGVWAVSSTGGWYGGDMVAAHGSSANYTHDLRLNVPTGGGWSTVVMYRPVAGSGAWTTGAYSPGTFTVN